MKLELGLDVLRWYKRLPYKPWHALAEFVDNSTQSYFNNKAALESCRESCHRPESRHMSLGTCRRQLNTDHGALPSADQFSGSGTVSVIFVAG